MTTLTLAKAQCRVTGSDEDTIIGQYLAAAVNFVEDYTRKQLAVRSVTEIFTEFPSEYFILLWGPDPAEIEIAYTDAAGDAQTITDALLVGDKLYYAAEWPEITANTPVEITYDAGFVTPPDKLVLAVLLLVGEYFENRSTQEADKATMASVHALCEKHRLPVLA